jgi:hypothetical protein
MPYLATFLITLLLAVPAVSVELFRCRGAGKELGTLECFFEDDYRTVTMRDSPFAFTLRISDFNGYTKVRSDTVFFSKLHGELPVLHHIPVGRGQGLKVTKPCGTFEVAFLI